MTDASTTNISNFAAEIERIASFPDALEGLVIAIDETDLHTAFIPGEWTVAQNVHHLADSHMNSFIRMKITLTEDHPTLKPFDQDVWATTADYNDSIDESLMILRGLHGRWSTLLRSIQPDQWERTAFHPENGEQSLADMVRYYANHCNAHIDQITRTLQAGGKHIGKSQAE